MSSVANSLLGGAPEKVISDQLPPWWKGAIVYQIYPSSFKDGNGDGIGDLRGILSELDYIQDLGIDVVWLSPIYKSPQEDMGYDISDYRNIDPRYGTLEDWDRLVEGLHKRGIKLIMDLVVNHTSSQHSWFKESRSSKTSPKRDWYIWRPPKYDSNGIRRPPNNWRSSFEGSAWQWDENTQEYYLHLYLSSQPDLNWDNPAVRNEIWDLMRFWLDRGAGGFRMDVINLISKVPGLPDAPIMKPGEEWQVAHMHYANGPRVHEYLKEMNSEVLSKYDDLITVGEMPGTNDMTEIAKYALPKNQELNMVFHFEHMEVDSYTASGGDYVPKKWKLPELKEVIKRWQTHMRDEGFWNSIYIQNHDRARCVSRFGNDSPRWRTVSAKMLGMLQIAQTGTLYVYQGEEIGMKNVPRSWPIEEYKDCAALRYYDQVLKKRKESSSNAKPDMSDILDGIQKLARDNARTPMQWSASKNAGFSKADPWMRVNDDYVDCNVDAQKQEPQSVLNFFKHLLKLRKANDVLIYGDFCLIDERNEQIFAILRTLADCTALVVLNFSEDDVGFKIPIKAAASLKGRAMYLLVSNYNTQNPGSINFCTEDRTIIKLEGYEGRIYLSKAPA